MAGAGFGGAALLVTANRLKMLNITIARRFTGDRFQRSRAEYPVANTPSRPITPRAQRLVSADPVRFDSVGVHSRFLPCRSRLLPASMRQCPRLGSESEKKVGSSSISDAHFCGGPRDHGQRRGISVRRDPDGPRKPAPLTPSYATVQFGSHVADRIGPHVIRACIQARVIFVFGMTASDALRRGSTTPRSGRCGLHHKPSERGRFPAQGSRQAKRRRPNRSETWATPSTKLLVITGKSLAPGVS